MRQRDQLEFVAINFVDIGIENWYYSFDGEIEWICDGSIIKREIISKLFPVNTVTSRVTPPSLSRLLGTHPLSMQPKNCGGITRLGRKRQWKDARELPSWRVKNTIDSSNLKWHILLGKPQRIKAAFPNKSVGQLKSKLPFLTAFCQKVHQNVRLPFPQAEFCLYKYYIFLCL